MGQNTLFALLKGLVELNSVNIEPVLPKCDDVFKVESRGFVLGIPRMLSALTADREVQQVHLAGPATTSPRSNGGSEDVAPLKDRRCSLERALAAPLRTICGSS